MGGTKISSPTPPPAPSVQDNLDAYVRSYPQLFALQQESAPKEIAQQLELLQQYGEPMAQAYKGIQSQLYPETTKLQEDLANQAQQGYTNGLTDQMKNMYRDNFKAQVGDQARAGIGADYVSSNLVGQDQAFRQYNQNLALSLAGRQPLTNPYNPQFTNQTGQMSMGDIMNYNQGNYGSQLAYSKPFQQDSGLASTLGGIGGAMQGVGALAAFCWVAAEVFEAGWEDARTHHARYFIGNISPKWFKNLYIKHGERFAMFIHNKPILKAIIKPLFSLFAFLGCKHLNAQKSNSVLS